MNRFIGLTTKRFLDASKISYIDEFRFIIGDQEITCHKFIAAFLSERVSRLLNSDPTANSFYIQACPKQIQASASTIKENEKNLANILQNLIQGETIEISNDDIQKVHNIENFTNFVNTKIFSILQIAESLENEEIQQQLYSLIFSFLKSEKENDIQDKLNKLCQLEKILNFLNVFKSVKYMSFENEENIINCIQKLYNEEYSQFINEIAKNFTKIDKSVILKMNSYILKEVLSSSFLQLENEDSLLDILLRRRSENNDENFLEFIEFQFLSENGIQHFLNEVKFNEINEQIWSKIVKRLKLPVKLNSIDNSRYTQKFNQKVTTFSYDSQNPFKGIFKHLTDVSGGNIHTNGTILITCSNLCCGKIESLVNFNENQYFTHVSEKGSPFWLQIDFKTRKVQINSYFIKMCNSGSDRFLRSWKLEISQDGKQWEIIDEREDVSELNGYDKMQLFVINQKTKPFQFIRIITEKDNWKSSYGYQGFSIGNLELYGDIL